MEKEEGRKEGETEIGEGGKETAVIRERQRGVVIGEEEREVRRNSEGKGEKRQKWLGKEGRERDS